jgi:hypothetical protein
VAGLEIFWIFRGDRPSRPTRIASAYPLDPVAHVLASAPWGFPSGPRLLKDTEPQVNQQVISGNKRPMNSRVVPGERRNATR